MGGRPDLGSLGLLRGLRTRRRHRLALVEPVLVTLDLVATSFILVT